MSGLAAGAPRPPLRRRLVPGATGWTSAGIVAAWGALVVSPVHGMGAMSGNDGMPARPPTVASWTLMTVAMMGPVALPGVAHVARNSLRWRRGRAALEYAAGYFAVWLLAGVVALAALRVAPGVVGRTGLLVALGAAAVWELTPAKRRLLRAGHRSVPLPPTGRPADRSAIRFGCRNGAACVGSCWCLMLAMALAPGDQLLLTVLLTGAVAAERFTQQPRRTTRFVAAGLALLAGAVGLGLVARG